MDQILQKVHNVDPNNSDEVKDALSLFFQKIPKYNDPICNKWLREMRTIIDRFPKFCVSHRNNIENYFIGFLSSSNYYSVIEVAKCAHALQQVRSSQEKTTPKSNWRDTMNILCNAAQELISAIYPNAIDIYKDTTEQNATIGKTPLAEFLSDVTKVKNIKDKQSTLEIRLKNVFIFIQAMLVETYPVGKPIRPQSILDVIVRALSVTSGNKQDTNVATIKIQALRALDALIMCLGSNLIPFSPLVFRLAMQTLRWTSDNPSESYRQVRIAAYSTLSSWLYTLRSHKIYNNTTIEDELASHMLRDITPRKKLVEFTMGPQPTKHLSKKARRKLANTQLRESAISAHMPGERNKLNFLDQENNFEVAVAALECAEAFLTVCGIFLKPNTHKQFQEPIVRECFNASYDDNHVIYLLRVLEASRKTTPNSVPPPTQYCLQLYSTLVNSQHSEISKFCSQALLDIRLHLFSSPPSINFAMEVPQQTKKTQNKRKKMSQKNRAVLESLLGKDRVPLENDEVDAIITIPDEPSNKKPRLEDSDKISLSSDDIDPSVEISDESNDNMVIDEVIEINESVINDKYQSSDKEDEIKNKENSISQEENDVLHVDELDEENNDDNINVVYDSNEDRNVIQVGVTNEVQNENEVAPQDSVVNENGHINDDKVAQEVTKSVNELSKEQEKPPIYEAPTQLPLNTSSEDIEDPGSYEVGYDYANKEPEKVMVIAKTDDELPSSSTTDDIPISCGQPVIDSQDEEKASEVDVSNEVENPLTNGVDKDVIINGDVTDGNDIELSKTKPEEISVQDMLADFVEEVNEAEKA